MLKEAQILELINPVYADAGDLLVIQADGSVEVVRRYKSGRIKGSPQAIAPTPQDALVGAPLSNLLLTGAPLGSLAPEKRQCPKQPRSSRLGLFTPAEQQAFEDLALQTLREHGELTAPQVAAHLGYPADSQNRTGLPHRTYDALVQAVVRLYNEGRLTRRPIGGGPLRVTYIYSLKEPAA